MTHDAAIGHIDYATPEEALAGAIRSLSFIPGDHILQTVRFGTAPNGRHTVVLGIQYTLGADAELDPHPRRLAYVVSTWTRWSRQFDDRPTLED